MPIQKASGIRPVISQSLTNDKNEQRRGIDREDRSGTAGLISTGNLYPRAPTYPYGSRRGQITQG